MQSIRHAVRAFVAIAFVAFMSSSCAVVTMTDSNGAVRVERHFGFVEIKFPEASANVTADVKAVGYYMTPLGGGLGVSAGRFAAMSPDCGVILWIQSEAHMRAAASVVERNAHVCVVQPNNKGTIP